MNQSGYYFTNQKGKTPKKRRGKTVGIPMKTKKKRRMNQELYNVPIAGYVQSQCPYYSGYQRKLVYICAYIYKENPP
jgi:hypothetical protein